MIIKAATTQNITVVVYDIHETTVTQYNYMLYLIDNCIGIQETIGFETIEEAIECFDECINEYEKGKPDCPVCTGGKIHKFFCYAAKKDKQICMKCGHVVDQFNQCAACKPKHRDICAVHNPRKFDHADICEFLGQVNPPLCISCKGRTDKVQGCPNHR